MNGLYSTASYVNFGTRGFTTPRDDYFKDAFVKAGLQPGSSQLHHIIPFELLKNSTLDTFTMMSALTRAGLFSMQDGHQNLMYLPTTSPYANATGLALHKGGDGTHSA